MKVVKLSATARSAVEYTRKLALPVEPNDDLLDIEEYRQLTRGSPNIVQVADTLLSDSNLWETSAIEPVVIERHHPYERVFSMAVEGTLVLYQDCLYDVRGQLTDGQRRLLVLQAADKERQLFERLKARFESPDSQIAKPKRERIPEHDRIAVWRRDQGRCARCGSRERLEYDHIIPLDRNGSNTVRNIELLCEPCNRAKGNSIQ